MDPVDLAELPTIEQHARTHRASEYELIPHGSLAFRCSACDQLVRSRSYPLM